MSNCGHYVLNKMYFMFRCTGLATYTKNKQRHGDYNYIPRIKRDAVGLYLYIPVLIISMTVGNYFTVKEVTQSFAKPLDFNALVRIFVYVEPTISATIFIMHFIKNTKKFLKAFETLNRSCNCLDDMQAPVSSKLIRFLIKCIYIIGIAGIATWYLGGAFSERLFEAFYKSMGFGIAFFVQAAIITALFCHMTLTVSAFQALNGRLYQLRKGRELWMRKDYLRLIATIHSDLCKAYRDIFRFCFPIVVLFFARASLQFAIVFMVFNGILAKGDIFFLLLPLVWYGSGCFFTALVNDALFSLRDTLLLQMLHQNTRQTFYGISFTMKILVSSIRSITTMLSLIVQVRSWIEK